MKSVNAALKTAIREGRSLEARPRLVAEWNMNKYVSAVADNIINEDENGFDIEIFPIESVLEYPRPTKGIAKARIDESVIYDFDVTKKKTRYYVADEDDVYKYWTSPMESDNNGQFPNHTDGLSKVRPHVIYSSDVSVNKIVVTIENYWASPNSFNIRVQEYENGPWTIIATNPAINHATGEIILYWDGSSWGTTKPSSLIEPPLRSIRGVMIAVNSMTSGRDSEGNVTYYRRPAGSSTRSGTIDTSRIRHGGNNYIMTDGRRSFFNLIEISARREVDLTDRLIEVDDTQDMSSASELYPIGTITSNTGSITLSNLYTLDGEQKTGYFSSDNPDSVYGSLVEPHVQFNLEYIYTVGGTDYSVQQFKMYSGEWEGILSDEVTIPISDSSIFLRELYPTPWMVEDMTVPEIFMRLLDSVGFVNWTYPQDDRVTDHIIPVFWVTGEENVWEVLDGLAKGTQSAIYFDAYGKLHLLPRVAALDPDKETAWTLRADDAGNELADIVSLEDEGEVGANHLTITYQTTKWDKFNAGNPAFKKIWEPEGEALVLRASPLSRTLNANDHYFYIPANESKVWPYEGIVQINGELIKYEGKKFTYYTGTDGNTPNVAIVKSAGDHKKFNEKTPSEHRNKNFYDGGLHIPVIDGSRDNARGYWNSDKRTHKVDMENYAVRRKNYTGNDGGTSSNSDGLSHRRADSSARLVCRGNASGHDMTIATIGAVSDTSFKFFGTRFYFVKESGLTDQRAGISFNNSANDNGYYAEIKATGDVPELVLYTEVGNKLKRLASSDAPVAIGTWQELDISVYNNSIVVWLNGVMRITYIPSGGDLHAPTGRFGMFVRGQTKAEFEYLYAIARDEKPLSDDSTYFNLIEGGYTGSFWDREWVYKWKTRGGRKKKKSAKERYRWNNYFFDDFGPYVHEVREFDVKFDPAPVQASRLYMTNEWQSICTEYRSTPFGAYFVLANASRNNAVVHGEDNLTLGGQRTIPQTVNVIGRHLIFADAETVKARDKDSIRIRGKVESELESKWIQTKAMAKDITEWMKLHWSQGVDQLGVEVFGNPLFEVGDVVGIEFPERHMTTSTHKYYVIGIETSFDEGISTALTLRRAI